MAGSWRSAPAVLAVLAITGTTAGAAICELLCVPGDAGHAHGRDAAPAEAGGPSCHAPAEGRTVLTSDARPHACGEHGGRVVAARAVEPTRHGSRVLPPAPPAPRAAVPPLVALDPPNVPSRIDGTDIPPPTRHVVLLI